jgi:cephalosporin hydroxylase
MNTPSPSEPAPPIKPHQADARSLRNAITKSVNALRRLLRPVPQDYQKRFALSLREWLLYHQRDVVFKHGSWCGIPMYKNPCDAWLYQQLIFEHKPEVIIEIGSCKGGSTLYFAHLFDILASSSSLDGLVVSVDIDRSDFRAQHKRIVCITGDSASAEIVAQVRAHCAGKKTLVIHDADHRAAQVLADLEAYAPLVSPGMYLIVEDGIIDLFTPKDGLGSFEAGPLKATEDFLKRHAEFVVDTDCERYLITHNPRGFLRKKSS